ncbi:MAG: hypothetical protein H0X34_10230 [Chthoniobacterales bacterium]|jgi:hypothetical protein|nr:hypothetical protein [Chthoniobacterales bacterium]
MKEQVLPPPGPPTIDCSYIEAARGRVAEMRAWKPETLDPPSVPELEAMLGQPITRCDSIGENWRNRVYRIGLENGATALAKQVIMGTGEMLQYQHDQLLGLAKLNISGLRVPKPLGLMREKRVLIMEFARGETIQALVWNRRRERELMQACELAGKILGQIEIARTEKIGAMPVKELARDLAIARWSLTKRQQTLLSQAFARLAGVNVRVGEVYYDYKPANLIFADDQISLIDPPDIFRRGVLLWDFACFRSSMRRHLWRLSLRWPDQRRRALIHQSLAGFERSYLSKVGQPYLEPALFATALQLLELQRTAVLMTMQQGKVELAQLGRPIALGKRLGSSLANRLTLPLLEVEKHWLFRQLARIRF